MNEEAILGYVHRSSKPRSIVHLHQATSPRDLDMARRLFRAYQGELGVDLGFQAFERELAELPGAYAPPAGGLLLAREGERTLGCVALRPMGDGCCEMKRLYVSPTARGTGLGRRLAVAIIDRARALGYRCMRLDTLDSLTQAMALYESLGFVRRAPYYANPLQGVVYWELEIQGPDDPRRA